MKRNLLIILATALLLTACASKKTAEQSANVTVTPLPLTYMNHTVPATITIQLPPKFIPKKDIVNIAFEMRYGNQHELKEIAKESLTVQGEMVEDYYPIVSYKNGKQLNATAQFPFKEGMENGLLVMTMTTVNGKKPTQREVVITEGVLCTTALVTPILNSEREAEGLDFLQQGRYTLAAATLEQVGTNNNTLLAQILAQDFVAAQNTLNKIPQPDALTHYLRAILGARMENADEVKAGLNAAAAIDSHWAQRAKGDLEFQQYRNTINEIVKP